MKLRVSLIALAIGLSNSAVPAVAADAQLIADANAFGIRESATAVGLSPDGTKIVYVAPAKGGGAVGFTADIASGQTTPFLRSGTRGEKLRWCAFVTNDRLICRYTGISTDTGFLIGYGRLIAINRDASDIKELGQRSSFYDEGLRQYDGDIIDWLPGGDGSVLMARDYVPEIHRTGSRMRRSEEGVGVDRIDTQTLKVVPVEPAKKNVSGYLTDGRGNVRLMAFLEYSGQQLTGRSKYYYRTASSREWRQLTDYVDGKAFEPLAIDGTINALYALKPNAGRMALYRISLTESPATELVASNPRVDIDQVVRSGNGQKVIGYSFAEDKREITYFDAEYKALATSLGRALPKLPLIELEETSADGSKVLVFAGSDADPGRYFVYDKKAKGLAEVLLVRPELEGRTLASVKPVAVRAPDGVTIPAYLTLPPGKVAKGLPAVVLPHGGPSSRDEWGFDWIAQFLAARGYAVLQPNYRGSAGFGDQWLVNNGFKSWRTSIGDITASARWMVAEGIANPGKLAVVGWSYGGYAALQSAVAEPSLFKAVAAIAPVTDLAMVKKEAEDFTNAELVAAFVGSGAHIAEGSPLRRASSIKVPVLLVHGDLDQNVGVAQSEKMEFALKAAGTPVEFLRFKDLDHQLDASAARTEMLTKIGELLDRTVGH
jgi:dipeptidyl aminopeptidase/acylaminoacyl peptidase